MKERKKKHEVLLGNSMPTQISKDIVMLLGMRISIGQEKFPQLPVFEGIN